MKIEEMIAAKRADCCGCEACANACPKNAITLVRDAEGFAYPQIDHKLCIACGKCDATCPALNFKKNFPDALPKVFVAVNPDEKIRRHSSSGGAFSALSEIILREGGTVFGAGFDKNFHVVHTKARTSDALENLRGSKYVQSQIGNVYRQVKRKLKSSSVLFSGTPCQCAGLKNFLGKDFDNLLTVDIICHGVPSPALWEKYIAELGYAHEITHVNFRSKIKGWSTSHLKIDFADQGYYLRPVSQDTYGKLFLLGMIERPSCHECKFKFPNSKSDLTIGDAWGVQTFAPDMFDERGISLVIVHTDKGRNFLSRTNLQTKQVNFFDAVMKNPRFISHTVADLRRKNIFADYARIDDKLSVMQYYSLKDGSELRKPVAEQTQRDLMQSYRDIAEHYRKKFERSVLILAAPRDGHELKSLGNYFEQQIPNVGVYILQAVGNGQLLCTENFSSLIFALKDNAETLNDLAAQLKLAAVFVEQPINLPATVGNWLKSCRLPIKTFPRGMK